MATKGQRAKRSSSQSALFPIALLIIAGIMAAQLYMMWQNGSLGTLLSRVTEPTLTSQRGSAPEAPTPTPTPTKLKQGRETYTYSWGDGTTIPKLVTLTLDPNDPKVGETQSIIARITHTSALAGISVRIYSDTKEATHPLTLSEGTSTDGSWTGSWNVADTILYRYAFRILYTTNAGAQKTDVVLRGAMP